MLKRTLIGLGSLLLALLAWGLLEPYLIDVERESAAIPHLPAAWEGKQVAQISDWQLGMWMDNEWTAARAVQRLADDPPALVLITGDFLYHPHDPNDDLKEMVRVLHPLMQVGVPVYAVLGNHDYGTVEPAGRVDEQLAQAIRSALDSMGVRVLENEAVPLPPPGVHQVGVPAEGSRTPAQILYLVGIGPEWPQRARPEVAFAGVPDGAPRLVMMHNPQTFPDIPAQAAPFSVAGHTHGGQVQVPFLPHWSWLDWAWEEEVHADGWAEEGYGRAGNRLYVNRGIGMGGVPVRINCRPEITLFTLHAGSSTTTSAW